MELISSSGKRKSLFFTFVVLVRIFVLLQQKRRSETQWKQTGTNFCNHRKGHLHRCRLSQASFTGCKTYIDARGDDKMASEWPLRYFFVHFSNRILDPDYAGQL